jgi:hypothetical protein
MKKLAIKIIYEERAVGREKCVRHAKGASVASGAARLAAPHGTPKHADPRRWPWDRI